MQTFSIFTIASCFPSKTSTICSKFYNIPHIDTVHGSDVNMIKKNRFLRKIGSFIIDNSDKITVNSTFTKNLIVDIVNKSNVNKIETAEEKRLFEILKAKRLELAKSNNVPPYVIFNDASLVEMAKIVPQSLDAMSLITGVGQFKLKKYGSIFLDILLEN